MNTKCPSCNSTKIIKKGYYTTSHNHQPIPRYRCKICHKNFSSHTNRETFGQHRPDLNQSIFELASSSVTMRRIAILVGCARGTVERKLKYISEVVAKIHTENLSKMNVEQVQIDEMETYQETKCKPLSISLAVDKRTGNIIDAQVAKMKCKGKLAPISQRKYPYWIEDTRSDACRKIIESVKLASNENVIIISDAKKSYPNIIKSVIPSANIQQFKAKDNKEFDSLFQINHVSAKIRADLSRMRRRTWACTKKWENLQRHLLIYIAWNNKYELKLNWV